MRPADARRASRFRGSVAILGFARSGRALAEALARARRRGVGRRRPARGGASRTSTALARARRALLLRRTGARACSTGADWLAISPGVPLDVPGRGRGAGAGIPVLAEIEIAWRIAEAEAPGGNRWIAVTGTNGKSTTTTWIAEILAARRAGPSRWPATSARRSRASSRSARPRDFVCEVSSFQLESVDRFRAARRRADQRHAGPPRPLSGLRRRTPPPRRGSSRARSAEDFAVVNADDAPSRGGSRPPARRVLFSRRGRPAGAGRRLARGGRARLGRCGGTRARGRSPPRASRCRARTTSRTRWPRVAAAECLGAPQDAIVERADAFRGPAAPQRARRRGAAASAGSTTRREPTSTRPRKSLEGFAPGSVLLILGGRDKHGDFAALAAARSRATPAPS